MRLPRLFESPRFKKAFSGLSVGLDIIASGAVHDLVRRYNSDPKNFLRSYDRIRHIQKRIVIEIDISGANRMIAAVNAERITLLDVGDHGTVGNYPARSLPDDIEKAVRARAAFWPDNGQFAKLFEGSIGNKYEIFANEFDPEWLYYLSVQQKGVADSILRQTARAHTNEPRFFIIAGGPGTGKTSILLKLLFDLKKTNRTNPALVVSNELAKHIQLCLKGVNLSGCQIDHRELARRAYHLDYFDEEYDVLLFDDPETLEQMKSVLAAAYGACKVVVLAFDPYQLHGDLTDSEYQSLLQKYEVRRSYVLTQCYRQKQNVGTTALKIMENIAASTPFLDSGKKIAFYKNHTLLSRISNELKFCNPYGYTKAYSEASRTDVITELHRLKRFPLWQHSPPLLLVIDARSEGMKWPWQKLLRGIEFRRVTIHPEDYSELEAIKGLEFQYAFLVIHEGLYFQLEKGFEGTGQKEYQRRRLLRIPWSRGKDGLVVFVTASGTK